MQEMFAKKGFSFIEVLSPCPTLYQRRNKMGDGLDTMKFYKEVSKVRNGAATKDVALDQEWRDHRRQVRRPRAQRLSRPDARQVASSRWATIMSKRRLAHASNGNPHRRIWRTGRHPVGHRHRQSRLHLPATGYSTMTQSFGPEARGGACSAQVILSDSPCSIPT